MSILERYAPKFQAANGKHQEKMVRKVANKIERAWTEDVEFDRDTVISVSNLSAKLDYSQIFLAYLQAPVWQV